MLEMTRSTTCRGGAHTHTHTHTHTVGGLTTHTPAAGPAQATVEIQKVRMTMLLFSTTGISDGKAPGLDGVPHIGTSSESQHLPVSSGKTSHSMLQSLELR